MDFKISKMAEKFSDIPDSVSDKNRKPIRIVKQCIDEVIEKLYESGEEIFLEQVMENIETQLQESDKDRDKQALDILKSLTEEEKEEIKTYIKRTLGVEEKSELDKPKQNTEEQR